MPPQKQDFFPGFDLLSPTILFSAPPSTSTSAPSPSLIILSAWFAANPRHISKYISGYRTLYPSAAILVLQTGLPEMAYISYSSQQERLNAAYPIICEYGRTGKVLLHLFSNGGAHTASRLGRSYRNTTGKALKVQAMVLDSSPGVASFTKVSDAVIVGLKSSVPSILRIPAVLLVYSVIGIFFVMDVLFPGNNLVERARHDLNDQALFGCKERLYIYSMADDLVSWDDVESHGEDAKTKGWDVKREKWDKTGHVGHMANDSERYWGAIHRLWES
ncbi:hypothetical protein B0O99DRAFT_619899 [Bisporella sp. PMI_857]|nr:hypothetical protein B0O99DRAFT_619899 [Bisporella sp. PMI_857]